MKLNDRLTVEFHLFNGFPHAFVGALIRARPSEEIFEKRLFAFELFATQWRAAVHLLAVIQTCPVEIVIVARRAVHKTVGKRIEGE